MSEEQNTGGAVAATKNKADAKRHASIRDILTSAAMRQRFADVLPSTLTPERMVRVSLAAMSKTPKLAECTQDSLLECLLDCAVVGLEPDGRRAHLIPYGNRATLIVDYKGLIELAHRNGDVALWRAFDVRQNDTFRWRTGDVEHVVDWKADRGEIVAVYSHVRFKDGNDDYEVMTLPDVEAIRDRSRAGKSGPWLTDFVEMAKKTVIRRHAKRLPLSTNVQDFVEIADKYDGIGFENARPVKGASFVRRYTGAPEPKGGEEKAEDSKPQESAAE